MKLNILLIVNKLARDTWDHRALLLKKLVPTLLLLIGSIVTFVLFIGNAADPNTAIRVDEASELFGNQKLVFALLTLWVVYLTVRMIVTVHRIYFGQGAALRVWHAAVWDINCWHFFVRFLAFIVSIIIVSLLLLLVAAFVAVPASGILSQAAFNIFVWVLNLCLGIIIWFFYFRVMMVFPSAAVGDDVGIAESFALTEGNGFRLLILLGIFPWLIKTIYSVIPVSSPIALLSVLLVIEIFLLLLWTGALTLCYQALTSREKRTLSS